MMKSSVILATALVFLIVVVEFSDAWSGHYERIKRARRERRSYCTCWYRWWGCSWWRNSWYTVYYYAYQCQAGWTHNGNGNCNIPICRPSCRNGGTCESPNNCNCPSTSAGPGCASLTCSYQRPCYPGDCQSNYNCLCHAGFKRTSLADGCTTFNSSHTELMPTVGKSNVTLAHIRRLTANNERVTDFMFVLEGLEDEVPGELEVLWSNQKRFNFLRFEYETSFTQLEGLPDRPNYVHESEIGIVESLIEANVSKVSRSGSPIRDEGSFKRYLCRSGFSRDNPESEIAVCEIEDDQFKTLIEHGDWLNIKFKSSSGGFQKLVNIDERSKPYATKYYRGLQDIREVQFNFDFVAPKHCSEPDAFSYCPANAAILKIQKEFTKDPIKIFWLGWTDDLSGVWEYYVEVFKLSPDPYGRLVEMEPLSPVFSKTVNHSSNILYPQYRPTSPGMYSVLVETRDTANNSRIARRLVLYDDRSEITLNNNKSVGRLYVSSAVEETGYMWQTAVEGKDVKIDVVWKNYFINNIIDENKLLNEVLQYPTQFKEIQSDGVLYSQKFVDDSLDDHEGMRTRNAIKNFHGIVKYEAAQVFTNNEGEPEVGWKSVDPFEERTSFTSQLEHGHSVRVWVRATDAMGNSKSDSTLVTVDGSPPIISKPGSKGIDHEFIPNVADAATYNFTSRIKFSASDGDSGVHKIGFAITITTQSKGPTVVYEGSAPASIDEDYDNPLCTMIQGKCFIPQQTLDLDNCWFLVRKSDLDTSTASVKVTAYNQALLTASTVFQVGPVKNLTGLEKYDGPQNIRIELPTPNGFRVAWDLPEKISCYGRAEIVIVLIKRSAKGDITLETYHTSGTSKYIDILGLEAETGYKVDLGMKIPSVSSTQEALKSLEVQTPAQVEESGNVGVTVGVAIGVLAIVAVVILITVFLIRKGYIHPPEQVQRVHRAVSRRVRRTYGEFGSRSTGTSAPKMGYDNRQSELYIYGGMDMNTPQIWHIIRNDVVFESLLKSGHFANIYKARLKAGPSVVVAKTLKERFTSEDELLMKAKINFTGEKVGQHPNVLKFIGAVVTDDAMGPFIIYEYCENGTLRDYLAEHKKNVTIDLEENLFRFGLDVAKGMEYLASRGIVHRRLAARNILLNFVFEVKIYGFGPQPSEEDGRDAEKAKRERIPIKWVAPECMETTRDATEKSDIWSYGVVLWEIFSLGETPYTGTGTDLPKRLKGGERLAKPELCDDTWYAAMKKCWAYQQSKRPTFSEIRTELDSLFEAAPGDDYYFYKR